METHTQILILRLCSHGEPASDNAPALSSFKDKLSEAGYNCTIKMLKDIHYDLAITDQGTYSAPKVVILDSSNPDLTETDCAAALADIRFQYGKSVPIIGLLPDASREDISAQFSSCLFQPVHPAQLLQRISSVLRLGDIRREVALRLKTLKHLNAANTPDNLSRILAPLKVYQDQKNDLNTPLRILFIGKATTEFMTIMNAMQERNVDFIAAFTSFTAFDYLHDEPFNGVIINANGKYDTALSIITTMRRNTALYNVPALVLTGHDAIIDAERAYEKGLNDILTIGAPSDETAGRILELAHFHRSQQKLKSLYVNLAKTDIVEADTGLHTSEFFKAHIGQNHQIASSQKTALTLAVFKTHPVLVSVQNSKEAELSTLDPRALKAALRQIGEMIRSVVRVQDCAARLSRNQFAILFPGKDEAQVTPIAQRICDMISCTAFDNHNTPFQIKLEMNIVPVGPPASQKPHSTLQPVSELAPQKKLQDSASPFTAPLQHTGLSA